MRRLILIISLFAGFIAFSQAQPTWKLKPYEFTAGFGPTMFFGDVGGYSNSRNYFGLRDISFLQTSFDINLNFRYRVINRFNARLSMTYGLLHATDVRGSNEGRGFEAAIFILEPALTGEYYFIKNKHGNRYLLNQKTQKRVRVFLQTLSFYLFTGIGGVSYSVKANDKLAEKIMNPRGFAAIIPAGLGTAFGYSPGVNFGFEVGGRYAFSDFIDGFSSSNSGSADRYYFINFTITYKPKKGSHNMIAGMKQ
jgi:hypothetical protein